MTKATVRGAALLAVVFLAGLMGGVALDRVAVRRTSPTPRLALKMPDVLGRLDLSLAQQRTADSILQRSSPRSEAAMRELVPRLAAIADSVNAELASILTPAQRLKLDSLTRGSIFIIEKGIPQDERGSTPSATVDTCARTRIHSPLHRQDASPGRIAA